MIEVIKDLPDNILAVNCRGQVHRSDYDRVLIPELKAKLAHHKMVRLFYRAGPEFLGIDLGAAIEDSKVGVANMKHWERAAVVTDVEWIRLLVRAFGFFLPCPVKLFSVSDEENARRWIVA